MATDKKFTVFGTSKFEGEYKVRFANDIMRVKILDKHNHEDVILYEVDEPMTKYEGIKTIQSLPEFASASSQSAIAEYLEDKAPKAKGPAVTRARAADTTEVAVKSKKVKEATV
jgi:hypothetical protein